MGCIELAPFIWAALSMGRVDYCQMVMLHAIDPSSPKLRAWLGAKVESFNALEEP